MLALSADEEVGVVTQAMLALSAEEVFLFFEKISRVLGASESINLTPIFL
jgi:hypothetical protein